MALGLLAAGYYVGVRWSHSRERIDALFVVFMVVPALALAIQVADAPASVVEGAKWGAVGATWAFVAVLRAAVQREVAAHAAREATRAQVQARATDSAVAAERAAQAACQTEALRQTNDDRVRRLLAGQVRV